MFISEHFRYRNDGFQSNIFVSDIGITDVNVGCQISPTLRSMLMPTYGVHIYLRRCCLSFFVRVEILSKIKLWCSMHVIYSYMFTAIEWSK
jgi:hypothetical protein